MTRTTNSRVAGVAYLLYIAVAFPSMLLYTRATSGDGMAAKLASMLQHASDVRLAVVLTYAGCFCALVLAVTLYAITRDQDRDLAMLALTCRVAEGVTGAATIPATLGLLAIATATGADAPQSASAQAVAMFTLRGSSLEGALFFAVGSTIFSWLLLRGRMVPTWLAWIGVVGSALVVIGLPLQILRVVTGTPAQVMWAPVAVFEIVVAIWLIVKGAAPPVTRIEARG